MMELPSGRYIDAALDTFKKDTCHLPSPSPLGYHGRSRSEDFLYNSIQTDGERLSMEGGLGNDEGEM